MTEQAGWCRTWSEPAKTGFLASRLKYMSRCPEICPQSDEVALTKINKDDYASIEIVFLFLHEDYKSAFKVIC